MSLRIAASQPEPTPEQAARREAMLAGFDGEPCRMCRQRRVVSSRGQWACAACFSTGGQPTRAELLHSLAMQAAFARE